MVAASELRAATEVLLAVKVQTGEENLHGPARGRGPDGEGAAPWFSSQQGSRASRSTSSGLTTYCTMDLELLDNNATSYVLGLIV